MHLKRNGGIAPFANSNFQIRVTVIRFAEHFLHGVVYLFMALYTYEMLFRIAIANNLEENLATFIQRLLIHLD